MAMIYFLTLYRKQINSWILIDSFDMFVYLNIAVTLITFVGLTIFALNFTFLLMYHRLNQFLALQNRKYQTNGFFSQIQLALKLSLLRREHNRITSVLILTNKLISKLLFATFLNNLPNNTLVLTLVLLGKTSSMTRRLMTLTLVFQIFSSASLLALIAICNCFIYKCKKHLVILQSGMGRHQLRDKIHHQRFYELVHYKQDIGFSVGLFGVLTKRKLYEVWLHWKFPKPTF